ncbi:hypothetical protein [Devosia sp. SL43]|uniref:hypothetical protein n=1 Tax=Devosia sp. SL43 TaxID=2806348 RepID=UPI001F360379|nr:hypothetical protein [Devosia sp. SL43]UJW85760.1 hypothetical protein IM737_00175 [Devosia sp. SL43]
MTPEEAREIDRLEFEADCRAARQRAYALVAQRQVGRPKPVIVEPPVDDDDRIVIRRSSAKLYSMDGKSLPLLEWAVMCGCTETALRYRMKHGMSFEQAVTTPRLKSGVRWDQQPGVGLNLSPSQGTGGRSTTQATTEIEFSQ